MRKHSARELGASIRKLRAGARLTARRIGYGSCPSIGSRLSGFAGYSPTSPLRSRWIIRLLVGSRIEGSPSTPIQLNGVQSGYSYTPVSTGIAQASPTMERREWPLLCGLMMSFGNWPVRSFRGSDPVCLMPVSLANPATVVRPSGVTDSKYESSGFDSKGDSYRQGEA